MSVLLLFFILIQPNTEVNKPSARLEVKIEDFHVVFSRKRYLFVIFNEEKKYKYFLLKLCGAHKLIRVQCLCSKHFQSNRIPQKNQLNN